MRPRLRRPLLAFAFVALALILTPATAWAAGLPASRARAPRDRPTPRGEERAPARPRGVMRRLGRKAATLALRMVGDRRTAGPASCRRAASTARASSAGRTRAWAWTCRTTRARSTESKVGARGGRDRSDARRRRALLRGSRPCRPVPRQRPHGARAADRQARRDRRSPSSTNYGRRLIGARRVAAT